MFWMRYAAVIRRQLRPRTSSSEPSLNFSCYGVARAEPVSTLIIEPPLPIGATVADAGSAR
jgi:hypothetical protein